MHGDEVLSHLGEHTDRDAGAAEVGAASTIRCDGTTHEQRSVVIYFGAGRLGSLKGPMPRRKPPTALDRQPGCPRPHQAGVGPAAEQQVKRRQHHGFAGARLTGEHGQSGGQREDGLGDDAESGQPDLLEHAARLEPGRLGGSAMCTFPGSAPAVHWQGELGHQPVGERPVV